MKEEGGETGWKGKEKNGGEDDDVRGRRRWEQREKKGGEKVVSLEKQEELE
ncbi:hypothetical protein Pcinc_037743, partial [Petrolisthes cinctipes]